MEIRFHSGSRLAGAGWFARDLIVLILAAPVGSAQFQEAKLLPSNGSSGGGHMGVSVSLDGDLALAGADHTSITANHDGAAYVFFRQDGSWIQEVMLVPGDPAFGDDFGNSVSISGNWAAIGARYADNPTDDEGAVYVFRRTGTFPFATWSQKAKLIASNANAMDQFGRSISLDGDTLAVGSRRNGGAAYIVRRSSGVWAEEAMLNGVGQVFGDEFGHSVAVNGDTLVVGSPNDDDQGSSSGSAYIFARAGTTWTQVAKLLASDGQAGNQFGYATSMEGPSIVIGTDGAEAAYVFEWDGLFWSETAKLVASDGEPGDRFGWSVAVEGVKVVVGALSDTTAGTFATGSAYVFEREGSSWLELGKLVPDDPVQVTLVESVALSGDTGLVGVPSGKGAAYVYLLSPPDPVPYCTPKTNSQGCSPTMAYSGVASVSDPTPFDVGAVQVLNNKAGILFYGVSAQASFPFQGGLLCVQPPTRRTPVQNSGGNPPPNDCSGVFTYDFNARIQSGVDPALVAGVTVYSQYWYRDPFVGSTTGLTDGLEFGIGF
jgi:hypothetical protein